MAQALFATRFLIQWIVSEKQGRSVIPVAFWYFSSGRRGDALGLCRLAPRPGLHPGAVHRVPHLLPATSTSSTGKKRPPRPSRIFRGRRVEPGRGGGGRARNRNTASARTGTGAGPGRAGQGLDPGLSAHRRLLPPHPGLVPDRFHPCGATKGSTSSAPTTWPKAGTG